jgi:MFS family permease
MLCCAVLQPVIGSFSSVFGRKLVLTTETLFFLAGCLSCALTKNFNMLLVFRSIQGAGGGGIVVMTEIIVCDMIPLRLRGEWFGVLSWMYAIGTVLGPILGGVFAQHVTWVSIPTFSHGVLDSDHSSAGCFISTFPSSV